MRSLVFALFVGGTISAMSWADVLDFGSPSIEPAGASISYAGGLADLIATGIGVVSISDLTNSNTSVCTGCTMAFTSGASTGTWTWGAGSATSILITGTDGVATGTLLSGKIESASIVACRSVTCIDVNTFINTVNPALGTVLGYTPPTINAWDGSSSLQLVLSGVPGSAFSLGHASIGSGDLTTSPIPEPGSLLLFGSALLGLATVARKKLFKV